MPRHGRLKKPWQQDRLSIYGSLPPQQMGGWSDEMENDFKPPKYKKRDTDEESLKRMVKVATEGDLNMLWHPHARRGGMVSETDFTHMDGPLDGPRQAPTAEEQRQPPGFNYDGLLKQAINNAEMSRKEYVQPPVLDEYGPYSQPPRYPGSVPAQPWGVSQGPQQFADGPPTPAPPRPPPPPAPPGWPAPHRGFGAPGWHPSPHPPPVPPMDAPHVGPMARAFRGGRGRGRFRGGDPVHPSL